tara:strand:+ start:72 stop:344 length:273 start_codon:yes stop_codon:yes gene_type:complete
MNNMNLKQELLVITMEECAELTQACSKIIRFSEDNILDVDDIANLQDEVGDVACMIELLKEFNLVDEDKIKDRIELKRAKLKKWSSLFNE